MSPKKKKPGAGAVERKRLAQEAKYEAKAASSADKVLQLKQGNPEILSASNEEHCKFAVKFAEGVHREISKIQNAALRFGAETDSSSTRDLAPRGLRSVYGFFGKSTIMVESLRADKEDMTHLSVQLGVPGCGKSTFLREILTDVYSGKHSKTTGQNPSVLIASTTNLQCKELFKMIHEVSLEEGVVPEPTWFVSHDYLQHAREANDDFTLRFALEHVVWPSAGSIIICTHDLAALRYAPAHFHLVVLDEIGAVDQYKGHCLIGLARHMAMIMGDPLQGSRPCPTLADKHVRHASSFKTYSHRCPHVVMQIVQPAYQAKLGDASIQLSGVTDKWHWCVQTVYNLEAVNRLVEVYGEEVLVMGFTKEATASVPTGRTVDATIGLEVAVAIVILELKPHPLSFQYDTRRLVPALTRCRHGVIVMWMEQSYERLPWRELKQNDGTHAVYTALCTQLAYEKDAASVIDWFVQSHIHASFCRQQKDDCDERAAGYEALEQVLVHMDALMDAASPGLNGIEWQDEDAMSLFTLEEDVLDAALATSVSAITLEAPDDASLEEAMQLAVDEGAAFAAVPSEEQERFLKPARVLARFVAEEISYMVIETRGHQHFASPQNKLLQKTVFQDLQHNEQGNDQGNHVYGIVYDLWVERMLSDHSNIAVPVHASKLKSSPAGNILESYKMIAEEVLKFEATCPSAQDAMCIEAATFHLQTACLVPPDWHVPISVRFETVYGHTGCVVWFHDMCRAQAIARDLLAAFNAIFVKEDKDFQ